MGFATALSGLAAAATSLQVIGNNIANANTTGFKESRAEFADVFNSTGKAQPGAGVRVTEVAQQFNQGNIESTQNNLDLALSGNGFFALGERSDSTNATAYTRNGAFNLSPEGFITNDTGHFLMGGAPIGKTIAEGFNTGAPTAIKIDTSQGSPSATSTIDLKVNLDSRDGRPVTAFTGYDPKTSTGPDVSTFNSSTSATIFDSLGNTHILSTYFVDETPDGAAESSWAAYVYLDGRGVNTGAPSTLDSPDGTLATTILATVNDTTVTAGETAITSADSTVTAVAATVTAAAAVSSPGFDKTATVTAATAAQTAAAASVAATASAKTAADIAAAANPANTDLAAAATAAATAATAATTAKSAADTALTSANAIADAGTLITAQNDAAAAVTAGNTAKTDASAYAVLAAVGSVTLVTGVTTQQIADAKTAAVVTSPTATSASVLAAAASAEQAGTKIPMTFDSLGNLTVDTTGTNAASASGDDNFVFSNIDISPLTALNVTAEPLTFSINPTGSTQFAADFGVNDLQQNGFASGNLTGISIDSTGVVLARFSNGTTNPLGQVILGRFTNNQGLAKIGDTTWQESVDSGTVVVGVAGGNNFGNITSSALENSNTDIATQLVKMIVAQQAYQANAQTISTEDEIIQRILQL
ncbi:MAG: flagellar hook-basal body complex protein [Methylococcaceae bacterium]